ncbi:MAG: hypothetical protein AAF703_01455 [Cyanobacteria bacterium P01_D01_bin.105]
MPVSAATMTALAAYAAMVAALKPDDSSNNPLETPCVAMLLAFKPR